MSNQLTTGDLATDLTTAISLIVIIGVFILFFFPMFCMRRIQNWYQKLTIKKKEKPRTVSEVADISLITSGSELL